MGLMSKITEMFSGGQQAAYTYQCTSCKTTFGAETDDKTRIRCPSCGSEIVRDIPK